MAQVHSIFAEEVSIAVFGKASDFALIRLDTDTGKQDSMAHIAQGYVLCGFLAVKDGVASANCEPGLATALAMIHVGVALAETLTMQGGLLQ